jgi:phosphoenolpyruvate carboxylase
MFGLTADNGKLLRVVPLFETLADLTNSPKIMESLFAMPRYLELIKYKHEIMIGKLIVCRLQLVDTCA